MQPNIVTCLSCFIFLCIVSCKTNQEEHTTSNLPAEPNVVSLHGRIEMLDAEAFTIIDSSAPLDILADTFKWTEGPLFLNNNGDVSVLFSDIPNNRIMEWRSPGICTVYLTPAGHTYPEVKAVEPGSNGLVLNAKGELVMCQHGDRRIAKMDAPLNGPAPKFITLAGKYNGKRLNSPNDLVYNTNSDLYFTDPAYGLDGRLQDTAKQLDYQGVYRLTPNGKLDLVTKDLKYPNGIAFSPDGKLLYVSNSDSLNMIWMRYELNTDGLIKSGSIFYRATAYEGTAKGNPDGMKVNKSGYVFSAGPEGIWIFNPAGKPIARILTPKKASNCAFSTDEKTLFITGSNYLMRMKLK